MGAQRRGECEFWLSGWLLFVSCVLAARTCLGQEANVFRAGAVLTEKGQGHTDEMQEAREGYELFARRASFMNNGKGFDVKGRDGVQLFFKFRFVSRNDGGDARRHDLELMDLLHGEEAVHFVFGSHPEFAESETKICQNASRLNYHCCVGPDEIYSQGFEYVFGIPASNRRYTQLALRRMDLRNLQKVAIIYREDNPFTRTTCESAVDFATDPTKSYSGTFELSIKNTYNRTLIREQMGETSGGPIHAGEADELEAHFRSFVLEAERKGVEAVVGCAFTDDGQMLVNAFTKQRYPLKSMFLTVGPTKLKWIQATDNSIHLLSAAQWHEKMSTSSEANRAKHTLEDPMFGTPQNYSAFYEAIYDRQPTYVSAGASAVGYTLMKAIVDALEQCDIGFSKGNVDELLFGPPLNCTDELGNLNGYERVRQQLEKTDVATFYGQVKFDENRRNTIKKPVTTQVLGPRDDCKSLDATEELTIEPVLPLGVASRELKMPACNPFREMCIPGHYVPDNDFLPCQPCNPGTFSVGNDSRHCDACPQGTYNSKMGQSQCTSCPIHTTSGRNQTDNTGCLCKDGYFEPSRTAGRRCMPCPQGATCRGGTSPPLPVQGFWVNTSADKITTVYECSRRTVCPGEGKCREGHAGRKCDVCIEGYFKALEMCFACISMHGLAAIYLQLVVVWYLLIAVVSRTLPTVEIFIGWVQLAISIGELDLRWPRSLELVSGVASLLNFDANIMEPTCFKSDWSYEENFVVQLLLPFIVGLMAMVVCTGLGILKALHKGSQCREPTAVRLCNFPHSLLKLGEMWEVTVAAFLSAVEVTYITIAKYSFNSFICEDVHGVSVMVASPEVECGSREHNAIRLKGALGVIFYVIGFPCFVLWLWFSLHLRQGFSEPTALRRYGFLYRRFKQGYFWTGLVILARRILFVLVLVLMRNAAFQSATLAAITIFSLMLHVYTAPYVDTYLDWFSNVLWVFLLFQCFGGMMFYAVNLPNVNRDILEVFILAGFVLLAIGFIVALGWEIRNKVLVVRLRRLHWQAVVQHDSSCRQKTGSRGKRYMERNKPPGEISKELLHTFDANFVYNSLKVSNQETLMRWDRLSDMLEDYVADDSETSYLSASPVATFWRNLVKRFPEIIDLLVVADEGTRNDFKDFITRLYMDFFLEKREVTSTPIFRVLNWRDRAPVAQWLAMAQEKDRLFFREILTDLYEANSPKIAAAMARKIRNHGNSDMASLRTKTADLSSLGSSVFLKSSHALLGKEYSTRDVWYKGPLAHSAKGAVADTKDSQEASDASELGAPRTSIKGNSGFDSGQFQSCPFDHSQEDVGHGSGSGGSLLDTGKISLTVVLSEELVAPETAQTFDYPWSMEKSQSPDRRRRVDYAGQRQERAGGGEWRRAS